MLLCLEKGKLWSHPSSPCRAPPLHKGQSHQLDKELTAAQPLGSGSVLGINQPHEYVTW